MGFLSGFLGGVTVTSAMIYLGTAYHRQTRLEQAMLLRQSSLTLQSVYEPQPPPPPPTAREARMSIAETAKDRWNAEVEGLAQRAYNINWGQVMETWEDRASAVWSKIFQKSREEAEKRL